MNPEATNTKKFLDMLNSLNLHQHVQCITRTTPTSTIRWTAMCRTESHIATSYLVPPSVTMMLHTYVLTSGLIDLSHDSNFFVTKNVLVKKLLKGTCLHFLLSSYIALMIQKSNKTSLIRFEVMHRHTCSTTQNEDHPPPASRLDTDDIRQLQAKETSYDILLIRASQSMSGVNFETCKII